MKIQVMSDLHLEFEPTKLPKISSEADVLVYAGDVSSNEDLVRMYFEDVRKETDAPIIYILGNHEYYGKFLNGAVHYRKAIQDIENCHLLDKDTWSYRGVRFLGCTLWTDFDDRRGELSAQCGMADYDFIRKVDDRYGFGYVSTADILREYYKCRNFLDSSFQILRQASSVEKAVVVTHHGPSFYCVPERYKGNNLNGAFYVELSNLIVKESPAVWVFGHTHYGNRVEIGSTDVLCNPWGYPTEVDTGYVEELLVEV